MNGESVTSDVQQLGDGLWTVAAGDYRCLFLETGDSVVVFNTLAGAKATGELRAAIAASVPAKPVSHIVYTIDHLDHTAGAAELAPDATVVAHSSCARVVAGRAHPRQTPVELEIEGAGDVIDLGGRRVTLRYFGPSQGTGNLAVIPEGSRALFVVGPRADARFGLFNDIHFRHVARIWRELAALDVDTVVPGRGPLMGVDDLRRAADYVDALAESAQRAFAEGVPIWVYEAMEPYTSNRLRDRFAVLDGFSEHVGIAAIRAVHYYLMGGWGLEDTPVASTA